MRQALGVDLGGTRLRVALCSSSGSILLADRVPTPSARGPRAVIEVMAARVEAMKRRASSDGIPFLPEAVGFAMPGPLDLARGVALQTPNLPGWDGFPVAAEVRDRLGLAVFLERDAPAYLFGEWRNGAAAGAVVALLLTLGTGVGGAALVDGRIFRGSSGMAGEFGHIKVVPDGLTCGCGGRGCLETVAGARGIERATGMGPEQLFAAKEGGDAEARDAVLRMAEVLGRTVGGLMNGWNPSVVVIGGGLVHGRHAFWGPMLEAAREAAMPALWERARIEPAHAPDWAGCVGAALRALDEVSA